MKRIIRKDASGVSEVIGTILILAMTVVLFSVIIIWVTNIPTPTAQTRLEVSATMNALSPAGINLTLTHSGGEALYPVPTIIYVTYQRGTSLPVTDAVILHAYNPLLAVPSGLLDGPDTVWEIGERWAYKNVNIQPTDDISITIVDTLQGAVVWSGKVTEIAGSRPPVFAEKWADDIRGTETIDPVQDSLGFFLYARVDDPDGDLNPNSVWVVLTMWYGIADPCALPQKMHDNGVYPDLAADDGVFTLGGITCMSPPFPLLTWDGSILLLNATDLAGHATTTRFVLKVVEQFSGGGSQTIPSQLWQYIGFVQIRAGQVWYTHMSDPVYTSNKFSPYRVTTSELNGFGGALFHLQMENHGNRTIFIDGWTLSTFSAASRASVFTLYIVRPGIAGRPANAGGLAAYPGSPTNPTNFQYVPNYGVFDINPLDQEKGGPPIEILMVAKTAFSCCQAQNFVSDSYFFNILVSGIAGPLNMTYPQILARWGAAYNPYDHLNDVDPTTRTQWYAQVIPFIGMTVY
jgi:hypothetical protein